MPAKTFESAFIEVAGENLTNSAEKIVHCLDQLSEPQIWWRPAADLNSIGILVVHLCGNLGQWIISGVGGAPDRRDRPAEFRDDEKRSKSELLELLAERVEQAGKTLKAADASQLLSPCRIQGFDSSPMAAIFHSVAHFQGHTQEIIALTRQQLGDAYRFHWTPTTPEQGAGARQD